MTALWNESKTVRNAEGKEQNAASHQIYIIFGWHVHSYCTHLTVWWLQGSTAIFYLPILYNAGGRRSRQTSYRATKMSLQSTLDHFINVAFHKEREKETYSIQHSEGHVVHRYRRRCVSQTIWHYNTIYGCLVARVRTISYIKPVYSLPRVHLKKVIAKYRDVIFAPFHTIWNCRGRITWPWLTNQNGSLPLEAEVKNISDDRWCRNPRINVRVVKCSKWIFED